MGNDNAKIGTVVIATAVLEVPESRDFLRDTLFRKFCPFYVSVSPKGTLRAFTGFCDDFEEMANGAKPPQYAMHVETDATGKRTVQFNKIEGGGALADPPEPEPARRVGLFGKLFGQKERR